MLDQEVARLAAGEQLIIRPGMKPMKTERICWFDDPAFRSLPQTPPEIPKLRIEVAADTGSAC